MFGIQQSRSLETRIRSVGELRHKVKGLEAFRVNFQGEGSRVVVVWTCIS